MLTSLLHVTSTLGYGTLFLLVGAESAGLPLPGETALVAAAVLAAHGHLELSLVIGIAAAAAIAGDNAGYLIGRRGVRRLLTKPGRWERRRASLLEEGETFFARHGGKAVFLGRWAAGIRVVVAWLAGAHRMRWPRFALWNALGGITWASSVGLLAYLVGSASSSLLSSLGLGGLAVALVGAFAYLATGRLRRARRPARGDARGVSP
jgi:membrane protein DedA with SNARE-associated domain